MTLQELLHDTVLLKEYLSVLRSVEACRKRLSVLYEHVDAALRVIHAACSVPVQKGKTNKSLYSDIAQGNLIITSTVIHYVL